MSAEFCVCVHVHSLCVQIHIEHSLVWYFHIESFSFSLGRDSYGKVSHWMWRSQIQLCGLAARDPLSPRPHCGLYRSLLLFAHLYIGSGNQTPFLLLAQQILYLVSCALSSFISLYHIQCVLLCQDDYPDNDRFVVILENEKCEFSNFVLFKVFQILRIFLSRWLTGLPLKAGKTVCLSSLPERL